MKTKYSLQMSYSSIAAFILAVIFIIVLIYINANNTIQYQIKLELVGESKATIISKDSLDKLNEIIKASNSVMEPQKLLTILENQRNYYNIIITSLTVLLTFAGVFTFFRNILEKQEIENLREDLKSLTKMVDISLMFNNVRAMTDSLDKQYRLFGFDGKEILNLNDFLIWIQDVIRDFIDEFKSVDKIEDFCKSDELFNFIKIILKYANILYKANDTPTIENPVFKTIIDAFQLNLNENEFKKFKKELLTLHNLFEYEKLVFGENKK